MTKKSRSGTTKKPRSGTAKKTRSGITKKTRSGTVKKPRSGTVKKTRPVETRSFDDIFKDYIAAGELRVPKSSQTGEILGLTARNNMEGWSSDIDWITASGGATLYSYVIYHQQYEPSRPVPYNVAMVELVEGPRLISTVIIEDPKELKVDMALEAKFDDEGRLVFIPDL